MLRNGLFTAEGAVVTISAMGRKPKKKPTGGKHVTKRTPVPLQDSWLAIGRQRAAELRMPLSWYLLSLIADDAKKAGVVDLPKLPWERVNE